MGTRRYREPKQSTCDYTNQPSLRMMDFVRSLEYMSSFVRGKAVCLRITMRCILCRHHFCSSRSSQRNVWLPITG